MDALRITDNTLKKYVACKRSGSESTMYHDDEHMLKIIHNRFLTPDRQYTIEALHEFEHPDIVTPEFSLLKRNKFVGYGMEYLKRYNNIYSLISGDLNNDKGFEERKKLMLELCEVFDYFDSMKYAFYDLHQYNILYKNGDMRIIDLDGGVLYPYEKDNLDYNAAIRKSKKQLARFTLGFLFDIDYLNLYLMLKGLTKKRFNLLLSNLPREVRECFEYARDENYRVYYGTPEAIESFTEDMFLESKDIIKMRLI